MQNRSLVSITDYDKEDYLEILSRAAEFEKNPIQNLLRDTLVATLFFEPSTRTRLSFETPDFTYAPPPASLSSREGHRFFKV